MNTPKIRYTLKVTGDFDVLDDMESARDWIDRMREYGEVEVVEVELVHYGTLEEVT